MINGKRYVGQTINYSKRINNHRYSLDQTTAISRAFKKYGFENFVFSLICICFDEDMNRFEIHYIRALDTLVTGNGYNILPGGTGGPRLKACSEEVRQRQSALRKGIKRSIETRQRMSEALKGRKLSEAHIAKMRNKGASRRGKQLSDAHKANISLGKTPIMKRVMQYNMAGDFVKSYVSLLAAAKALQKYNAASISRTCHGKQKQAYGFIWKFSDETTTEEDPDE